jgi:superfamily II DNA or RNA helicase
VTAQTLRPYQRDALAAVRRDQAAGEKSVAIEIPTGGGKTTIFAEQARWLRERGLRSLVSVHREELVDQAMNRVRSQMPGARVGRVQGSRKDTVGVDVAVGMIQTLSTTGGLEAVRAGDFGYAIIDEAHHAPAPSYRKMLAALPPAAEVLGVSATLARSDRLALGEVFSKISYVKPIIEMIREGWLVRPRGRHVFVDGLDLSRVRRRGGDFADGALATAMKDSLAPDAILRAWQEHAKGRPTIGFAPTVEMAYLLAETFRTAGVRSRAIHGDQTAQGKAERRKAVADYRAGEIEVLWNVGVLTEGFDAPETSCVIMARPTSSAVLFTQCVGRGLRLASGKVDCLILDVVGVLGRHRLATLASLDGAASEGETPDELLAYEDDWDDAREEEIDLAGEGPERAGPLWRPEFVDGRLDWTEIELFEESAFAWLRTEAGTPFIIHDRQVIFPVLRAEGGVALAMVPVSKPGGEMSREVYADIPDAMAATERWLSTADYVRRSESWRQTSTPTKDQVRLAADWGVIVSEGMRRGDVSDAINVAMASRRIDHLPITREGV